MYNYGVDHRELCGQFLVLIDVVRGVIKERLYQA